MSEIWVRVEYEDSEGIVRATYVRESEIVEDQAE